MSKGKLIVLEGIDVKNSRGTGSNTIISFFRVMIKTPAC